MLHGRYAFQGRRNLVVRAARLASEQRGGRQQGVVVHRHAALADDVEVVVLQREVENVDSFRMQDRKRVV